MKKIFTFFIVVLLCLTGCSKKNIMHGLSPTSDNAQKYVDLNVVKSKYIKSDGIVGEDDHIYHCFVDEVMGIEYCINSIYGCYGETNGGICTYKDKMYSDWFSYDYDIAYEKALKSAADSFLESNSIPGLVDVISGTTIIDDDFNVDVAEKSYFYHAALFIDDEVEDLSLAVGYAYQLINKVKQSDLHNFLDKACVLIVQDGLMQGYIDLSIKGGWLQDWEKYLEEYNFYLMKYSDNTLAYEKNPNYTYVPPYLDALLKASNDYIENQKSLKGSGQVKFTEHIDIKENNCGFVGKLYIEASLKDISEYKKWAIDYLDFIIDADYQKVLNNPWIAISTFNKNNEMDETAIGWVNATGEYSEDFDSLMRSCGGENIFQECVADMLEYEFTRKY